MQSYSVGKVRSEPKRLTCESDQWFTDPSAEEPRRIARESLASLVASIALNKPFPQTAWRVGQCIDSGGAPADVARMIEEDPILSAQLLRLVNSAGFALRIQCGSVRHAAALAGTSNIRELVMSASVLSMFDRSTSEFVHHSLQVAALARVLGGMLSLDPDSLYASGFMHDIGKLMLLEAEGTAYRNLLDRPQGCTIPTIHEDESRLYGFDHAILAAEVMRRWHIPEHVIHGVEYHHRVGRSLWLDSQSVAFAAVVSLADRLAYGLALPSLATAELRFDPVALDYLNVSDAQLEQVRGHVRSEGLLGTRLLEARKPHPTSPVKFPESAERLSVIGCDYCQSPTFGQACVICLANVCPSHVRSKDGWCDVCVKDSRSHGGFGMANRWAVGILLVGGVPCLVLFLQAARLCVVFGSLGATIIAAVFGFVMIQWMSRRRFLRRRRAAAGGLAVGGDSAPAPSDELTSSHSGSIGLLLGDVETELIRKLGELAKPLPSGATGGPEDAA